MLARPRGPDGRVTLRAPGLPVAAPVWCLLGPVEYPHPVWCDLLLPECVGEYAAYRAGNATGRGTPWP